PVQMATVRPGMLPRRDPREDGAATTRLAVAPRRRVRVLDQARDDDTSTLAEAAVVIGVGGGLAPDDYAELGDLLAVLGAELGALAAGGAGRQQDRAGGRWRRRRAR